MKKKWFVLLLLFLLLPSLSAQGERFKAVFMYNFTKYLEWPAQKQKGDFVIGVYGNSGLINELKIIAQKRKVGTQQIVVKKISDLSELSGCNIIYLPESRSSKVNEIKTLCRGKGVVLITDKSGLAKTHAGINYVMVNGKQNFEINKSHLEGQGVKVNSALMSLGISVE